MLMSGNDALIESSFRRHSNKLGDFEVLVMEGNNIVHYRRDNSDPAFSWHKGVVVSSAATGPACLIEGSFRADPNKPGNFEVLVLEEHNLVHYWRDNSDPAFSWHKGVVVSSAATGPACLIEGSFRNDLNRPGNFEALVPEEHNLVHYSRDNSDSALPWHKGMVVSSAATGPACLIEGNFRADPNKPGNFEVLVLEEHNLVHYSRDNSKSAPLWQKGVVISSAGTGPACLIEGSFRSDPNRPGNFETLVLEEHNLVHYSRDNSDSTLPWQKGVVVSSYATGPASLIEGSFRTDPGRPGNFEALVQEENNLVHYWRDNSNTVLAWRRGVTVMSDLD
jgi:hypothetical protein